MTTVDQTIARLASEGRTAPEIAVVIRQRVEKVQDRAKVIGVTITRTNPKDNKRRRLALFGD